jgi:hypothetical protein
MQNKFICMDKFSKREDLWILFQFKGKISYWLKSNYTLLIMCRQVVQADAGRYECR